MAAVSYLKPVLLEELDPADRAYVLEDCVVEEKLDGHLASVREGSFIVFVEDLRVCHTIMYRVPAPAIALDVYDLRRGEYLPLREKHEAMLRLGFLPPPVLHVGPVDDPYEFLRSRSLFAVGINPKAKRGAGFSAEGAVFKRYRPRALFAKLVNEEFEEIRGTFDFRRSPVGNEVFTFSFDEFRDYWGTFGLSPSWEDYLAYLRRHRALTRM